MGRRRCCCGCWTRTDDFNRDKSTDLGPLWVEVSGDWAIDDNQLQENGTSGAIAKFVPTPNTISMIASVKTVDEVIGDKYRVIVNYADASNYMYAELTIGNPASSASTLALWKVVAGVHTELESDTIDGLTGTGHTIYACIGSKGFEAHLVGGAVVSMVWDTTTPVHATGVYSGLGNGGSSTIYFDDFMMMEHIDTDPTCPGCICYCDGNSWPKTLTLTITSDGVRCFQDASFNLVYDRVGPWWIGSGAVGEETWEMKIACQFELENMVLAFVDLNACNNVHLPIELILESSTCDPINFAFKIEVAGTYLTCCPYQDPQVAGTIYFTVTE